MTQLATDAICYRDAYLGSVEARILAVDADDGLTVVLDRTVFYPGGGGQPADRGLILRMADGRTWIVTGARKDGGAVVHLLERASDGPPLVGDLVRVDLDWARRLSLMRTHTALHVLCGVIWNEWAVPVTGGNMEPLSARMDFEFDPLPEGFGPRIEALVNAELAADRPIEVGFLPRSEALADEDLIRTKVNLIPESVTEIRVVDIVGLDKQADGGTHVRSTGEVGRIRVVKTESKGKGNKRIRIEVVDA